MIQSRERAKALIMAGVVFVNEQKVDQAGEMIKEDAKVEVRGHDIGYVSRGGLKLEKAMQCFPLTPNGKVCMDIGASTGGFTDCLLRRGAVRVYAVDSGSGQLVPELAEDSRVISLENTNARYIDENTFGGVRVSLAVMDVSFISQKLLYPALCAITESDADIVTLVKPQFEAGRAALGKNGVVKDEKIRRAVVEDVVSCAALYGLEKVGVMTSPITGGSGNVEYLLHLKKRHS